jgi:hypothetical protein
MGIGIQLSLAVVTAALVFCGTLVPLNVFIWQISACAKKSEVSLSVLVKLEPWK